MNLIELIAMRGNTIRLIEKRETEWVATVDPGVDGLSAVGYGETLELAVIDAVLSALERAKGGFHSHIECNSCGDRVPAGDFCMNCGKDLSLV